jgi:hypothetical protein
MAVSAYLYGAGLKALLNKEIDWDTDVIKVALCTSAYTPAQTTHDYFNDLTGELSTGGGYTAGGSALSGGSAVHAGGTTTLYANNLTWGSMTGTARYAVIYDSTPGAAASDPLIAFVDFGTDVVSSGGNFTITWNASGIATYAVTLAA